LRIGQDARLLGLSARHGIAQTSGFQVGVVGQCQRHHLLDPQRARRGRGLRKAIG
jgi:hypothetical protein